MGAINRNSLKSYSSINQETVDINGLPLIVRELSAKEMSLLGQPENRDRVHVLTFAMAVLDEQFENVFDYTKVADLDFIEGLGFSTVRRVVTVAQRLSGIDDKDVDEIKKSSATTTASGSASV
jgi:hypothetical protein